MEPNSDLIDLLRALNAARANYLNYIGRDDFIANKQAAGRPRDLVDIAYLQGAMGR